MAEIYFMDIPATNVAANYPTDGVGGVSSTAAEVVTAAFGGGRIATFRILGLEPLASAANTNDVTITTAGGSTVVVTLPTSATAGGYYPLPEQAGKAPADVTAYATDAWPGALTEGMPVGNTFTVDQERDATWAVRVWFTADAQTGITNLLP